MKQTVLNLLGCSSFSALALLGQTAQADVMPTQDGMSASPLYAGYITAPQPAVLESSLPQTGCSCQDALLDANSDQVGDLAIDQLGCDCAGCRNIVMQMAQAEPQPNP
ncbi:MAG: hypothetical protein EDM05_011940 [Leptolyngbya sp. IPPAS B-1204]|nr:MAG: hypothetical protein EDM05_32280 [Leptolyngbya sp. IPPAS B-1204]